MIRSISILAVLFSCGTAVKVLVCAAAVCKWVEAVSFCTATVEGAEGDKFVATNIAAAVCIANVQQDDLDGGCITGLHSSLLPTFFLCMSPASDTPLLEHLVLSKLYGLVSF